METTKTITIEKLDETNPAALFCHYSGESEPQDCYLELGLEDATLRADYNGEIGGGIPMSVFHGRTRRYPIPCLTATAANALMEELAPLAQRVCDGSEIEWDGNNWVGSLNEDAAQADDEIAERCDPNNYTWDPSVMVEEMSARDWWPHYADRAALVEEYGITADTTDKRLAEIAEAAEVEARNGGNSGYTVVTGVEDLLSDLRSEMREQVSDKLEEVAERARAATERRNELIRQMVAWGDDRYSHRGIAATAGLSHTHVGNIVRRAD